MRCPKCSYLSYDDVERCRNCGYDFSLASGPRETEAPVAVDPTHEPRTWEPQPRRRPGMMDASPPPEGGPLDLPLFEDSPTPEPPPVMIPPAGPPLSVRRKVEITRPSPRLGVPADAIDPEATSGAFDWPDEPTVPATPAVVPEPATSTESSEPIGPRLKAGVIDTFVLGGTDLLVVWLTLRVAGVSSDEWRLLPLVPLAGFLFLLDTAYLVTFTAASGQTIGKMLSGIRVVYGDHGRVPFGHAVLRSVALLLCAIPAGLGLLPLFMDPERRGAHDRLAGTRVVPAAEESLVNARLSVAVATALGVGYVPFAPGTFGSLAGLVVFAGVRATGQPAVELAAIVAVFFAGVWAATAAEAHFGHIDPGPVVIDEVLGMLVTLTLLPVSMTGVLVGFVLFRVFDVIKPPPCNRFEALPGGWGVMCDDLMAAVYAHACVRMLAWVAPAWMLA